MPRLGGDPDAWERVSEISQPFPFALLRVMNENVLQDRQSRRVCTP